MKKSIVGLLTIVLILVSVVVIGQNFSHLPKVKTKDGVECYLYTVEVKEGLYGISRKFDVKQEDILRLNPEANQGLKVGQQLMIPIVKQEVQSTPSNGEIKFTEYVVPSKKTVYSISKEFGVSTADLEKYNPEIKDGLREGSVLRIPTTNNTPTKAKTTASTKTDESVKVKETATVKNGTSANQDFSNPASAYRPAISANSKSTTDQQVSVQSQSVARQTNQTEPPYKTHTIKAKETLYSISKLYNLHVEDVINANPMLESSLKIGDELRIPLKSAFVSPSVVDSLFRSSSEPIKIAFLLPFYAFNDANSNRFLEFYSGALVAINDAKARGISFEIFTYDTDKTEDKIQNVLSNPELRNVDFIIGPAYSNQILQVGDFAKRNKIYTLIPFSSKVSGIAVNPYLIQFNPGYETEVEFDVEQFVSGQYKNSNLVFVKSQQIDILDDGWTRTQAMQTALTKRGRAFKNIDWNKASDPAELTAALKTNQHNLVIFRSDKYTVVQPYLTTLTNVSANTNVSLFVQYSWLGYSLQQNEVVYVSPFLTDMNKFAIKTFQDKFSALFNWDVTYTSPRYDLLGYDLTTCFIKELNNGGQNFGNNKTTINYPTGIQSQFLFERSSTQGGFINQRLYMTNTSAD